MTKEITVTLTEQSHKHAEMMIHRIANPELVVLHKYLEGWIKIHNAVSWNGDEYFLCHPNHTKECLHWLNGGDVETAAGANASKIPPFAAGWHVGHLFMNPESKFRIKQEPEYVRVESIFDLSKDEKYYFRDRPGNYLIIEHATEDYILLQLNGGGLYRKVEQGD